MDNKLSKLSKPVAWTDSDAVVILKTGEWAPVFPKKYHDSFPLYSQEYVSALLAEREEKDKRIAELEVKLATPVDLPVVLMGYQSEDYREGFMDGLRSVEEIRKAGSTVEGMSNG